MKQKIIDYIEELERKAQDGERYFKLWHKEYHKNKQAIEYINNTDLGTLEKWKLQKILKGDNNE